MPTRKPPKPPAPCNGDPKAAAALTRARSESRAVSRELRLSRAALAADVQRLEDLTEELRALVALLEVHVASHPKVQAFIAAATARFRDRRADGG